MKNNLLYLNILIFLILNTSKIFGERSIEDILKLENKPSIVIDYENKDLEFILLEIASFKGINILIPQENQRLNAKVTLKLKDKVTLDEAWNLILELLTITGYSLNKQADVYSVIKNNNFASESMPTYINQDPPNNELPVRYLYFFENISISDQSTENTTRTDIESILNDILTPPASSNFMFISGSNALLITDKGSIINGVMNILKAIDKTGFSESIAVLPLRYADAGNISRVLNQLIPNQSSSISYGPILKKQSSVQDRYFSENTKITTLDYSNSLVILASKESINKIKKFIYLYLDVPLEIDRSVITVVPLNYLEAEEFAPILQDLLTKNISSNDQSTSSSSSIGLQNAIIVAENLSQAGVNKDKLGAPAGGNNLLIAAKKQDAKMIIDIIEQMDKPEPQVILEAVIVGLTQSQLRGLGFLDTRSPNNPYSPSLIKWQGNTQGPGGSTILNYVSEPGEIPNCTGGTIDTNYGVAADLLALCNSGGTSRNLVTQDQRAGTLLVSFSNGCGGVSALLQMFDQYGITNDFRDPFIVTKNNKKASITSAESRIVNGATSQESTGGPVQINQEVLSASLSLVVTPRISHEDTVNLDIEVEVSQFKDPSAATDNNTIDRRTVHTSAYLKSGEILVIGGVSKTNLNESVNQSPFAKVPLLGWLFKSQNKRVDNKSIYIFISPIIIRKPASIGSYYEDTTDRLNQGLDINKNNFTNRKINHLNEIWKIQDQQLYGSNLENLRDPITKIFFSPDDAASKNDNSYIPLR
jgi:general secretion pathway protein D